MLGFDVESVLRAVSYPGIFGIIYSETAFLIGFFLPGDTLLLSAGLLSVGDNAILSLKWVIPTIIMAAILGDTTAYLIGRRFGSKLFSRPESRFFKPEYAQKAQAFFERYGSLTLTLAKFIPVIRALAPTMAGTSQMPYPRFLLFSGLGAVLWGSSLPTLAYYLGRLMPPEVIERYVLLAVGIVLLSAISVSLYAVFSGRKIH